MNKVYYISKGAVKQSRRQYGPNPYEMTLGRDAAIMECRDNLSSVPSIMYNFVAINQLMSVPKDSIVDVVAVVRAAEEPATIIAKTTQKQLTKRNVTLADQTGCSVSLTLWNQDATGFPDDKVGQIVAIKGTRTSDFGGVTLNGGTLQFNPDIPEAHVLRGWFDSQGGAASFSSLSEGRSGGASSGPRRFIDDIRAMHLGTGEQPDFFQVQAAVMLIKSDSKIMYPGCPEPNCKHKVTDMGPNQWHCEHCQKTFPNCLQRYCLGFSIVDMTGLTWVSSFHEVGCDIMGVTADELDAWRSTNPEAFDAALQAAHHRRFIFTLRAKQETYNDDTRVKINVLRVAPVDPVKESASLIGEIRKLMSAPVAQQMAY